MFYDNNLVKVIESMNRSNIGASTNFMQILLDIFVGSIAFFLSAVAVGNIIDRKEITRCFVIYVVFMFIYILTNKDSRVYNMTSFFYLDRIIKYVTKSFVLASAVVAALLFYVANSDADKEFFSTFLVFGYFFMLLDAFVFRYFHKRKMKDFFPRTVYIGEIRQFEKFDYFMNKTNIGINFLGYIRINDGNLEGYLGNVEDLENLIRLHIIDQVYIMQSKSGREDLQEYIDLCMEMGVTVRVVMDFYEESFAKSYVSSVGTYPVYTFHTISLNNSEKVIKRLVDIIGAMIGIMVTLPIMIVTALLIKLTSKGPIIFKQERVGMNGRTFSIYKFRTMCENAESLKASLKEKNEVNDDCLFKMKDDPRITGIGRILRKTSIDELPQFFNVLIGNMSLVGTRPPTLDEVKKYKRNHWRRISIKPGITGMWQVSGRSEITDFDKVVDLDTRYIDEWSVFMDMKVILKTIQVLIKRDGAY